MAKAPNNIGAARREYAKRVGAKFTQEDAAKEFGVSLSAYRNYEQEVNLPNAGIASAIARKYGVSVDYLLGYAQDSGDSKNAAQLSKDEKELLDAYRQCDPWERDLVLKHAKMVMQHGQGRVNKKGGIVP
jgi:transcriptional regulator with XRE-family HTH domain